MADLKTIAAEVKRGEAVFFLGAGMSRNAGLPTAAELAEQLPADFKPYPYGTSRKAPWDLALRSVRPGRRGGSARNAA